MNFSILKSVNPYINLAIEEYLLRNSSEDFFLLWQNEPTVVIGKNQNAYAEIDLNFTENNKIHIARRITGGGAVYHDLGNLNYSFISNKNDSEIDFYYFSKPIIDVLRKLGIQAELSGRNDIIVENKKISGNAQTVISGRVLHHGTLLFDSDLTVLSHALVVNEEKIRSKAIKSVSSRVTNINSYLPSTYTLNRLINQIKNHVLANYNAAEFEMPINEQIKQIALRNASSDWLYPKRSYLSDYTVKNEKRYDFGTVSLVIKKTNEIITDIDISGDFFGTKDIKILEEKLKNLNTKSIEKVLSSLNLSDYIMGMSNAEFIALLAK